MAAVVALSITVLLVEFVPVVLLDTVLELLDTVLELDDTVFDEVLTVFPTVVFVVTVSVADAGSAHSRTATDIANPFETISSPSPSPTG